MERCHCLIGKVIISHQWILTHLLCHHCLCPYFWNFSLKVSVIFSDFLAESLRHILKIEKTLIFLLVFDSLALLVLILSFYDSLLYLPVFNWFWRGYQVFLWSLMHLPCCKDTWQCLQLLTKLFSCSFCHWECHWLKLHFCMAF